MGKYFKEEAAGNGWLPSCVWVTASLVLSNAFKQLLGLSFVWFSVFHPSVIVILGRKGGLRQAAPPQKDVDVGLGHVSALDVPMR